MINSVMSGTGKPNESQSVSLRVETITHYLRKGKWWIIGIACVAIVAGGYFGVTLWFDPPVLYYSQWIGRNELFEQVNNSTFCVQNPVTGWYRQLARVFPTPSSFICFNTDAEARRWMQQHPAT